MTGRETAIDVDSTAIEAVVEEYVAGAQLPATLTAPQLPDLPPVLAQRVAVPRNPDTVQRRLKWMAAQAGDDWYYRFPVRDKGATKHIQGPTIKCADAVAREYGNCAVQTRAVEQSDGWTFYARFADHETGFSLERPFFQRREQQTLKTKDQGRAEQIAYSIGVSKAQRNVIVHALNFYIGFAVKEAERNLVQLVGKDLAKYRARITQRLDELHVPVVRVERAVGRNQKDWLAPDCARIIAELQAIGDGMATTDETWPEGTEPRRATERNAEQPAAPARQTEQPEAATPATADTPKDNPSPFEYFDAEGELTGYGDAAAFAARAIRDFAGARSKQAIKTLQENNRAEAQRALPMLAKSVALDLTAALALEE